MFYLKLSFSFLLFQFLTFYDSVPITFTYTFKNLIIYRFFGISLSLPFPHQYSFSLSSFHFFHTPILCYHPVLLSFFFCVLTYQYSSFSFFTSDLFFCIFLHFSFSLHITYFLHILITFVSLLFYTHNTNNLYKHLLFFLASSVLS